MFVKAGANLAHLHFIQLWCWSNSFQEKTKQNKSLNLKRENNSAQTEGISDEKLHMKGAVLSNICFKVVSTEFQACLICDEMLFLFNMPIFSILYAQSQAFP